MTWILIASGAYFLGAFANILDKFLLGSKRISSPAVYTFYVTLLGLGSAIFLPFVGLTFPSAYQIVISFISGLLFSLGIMALYFAIRQSQASRVIPVIGAMTPVGTYIFSFFVSNEVLNKTELAGMLMLVFGGLLLSFDLPLKINKKKFFSGFYHCLLSALLLSGAYAIFKLVYAEQTFFNGFFWTRVGSFLVLFVILFVPKWRKEIIGSFKGMKKARKENYKTGALFISNKIIGGTSSLMFNYAISLGSATLVNSLTSVQYVFVVILAFFASLKYPKIFDEKLSFNDWLQRFLAIAIIAVGIYLVSGILTTGRFSQL